MKSQNITTVETPLDKRWYEDACATALALEFVGERWALLIIRELMLGPRRFSDLRAALTGISANILSMRLDRMERLGIVQREQLDTPFNVQAYALTPWGQEAEPIFQAMGRWALRSPLHDPLLPLTPVSAVLSLRTLLKPDRPDVRVTVNLRFGADAFIGCLSPEGLALARGQREDADVSIETDTTRFVRVMYGKQPVELAEREGQLNVRGDRELFQRFIACFSLPEKYASPRT
ncbi:MAG: winged helix-turn-helix transcriptional regulator [Pigmentiphaga sp.]